MSKKEKPKPKSKYSDAGKGDKNRVSDINKYAKNWEKIFGKTKSETKHEMNSEVLYKDIVNVCKTIQDPEIPQNIWDMGLVYSVDVNEEKNVELKMTLTSPGCPVGPEFLNTVKTRVSEVRGVNKCNVELVWDPPWDPSMMSEETQTMLGMELNRPMLDGTFAGGEGH